MVWHIFTLECKSACSLHFCLVICVCLRNNILTIDYSMRSDVCMIWLRTMIDPEPWLVDMFVNKWQDLGHPKIPLKRKNVNRITKNASNLINFSDMTYFGCQNHMILSNSSFLVIWPRLWYICFQEIQASL